MKSSEKVYSSLKVFHYTDYLDRLANNGIVPPIHIRIKPTNYCNHNCWYCSFHLKDVQIGKDMVATDNIPEHKMNEIVKDIVEIGVKAVTFSGGGEPLCYPNIDKFIKQLTDNNVKVGIITNGSNLDKYTDMLSAKATWVRVSMDGYNRQSYFEHRGVDDFDKVMDNILKFNQANGKCLLSVYIVVSKWNYKNIYELISQLYMRDVKTIKLASAIISNSEKDNKLYHNSIEPVVTKQIKKVYEDFVGVNIYYPHTDEMKGFVKQYDWCPYAFLSPVIGADCNVYYCHDKAYNKDTGIMGSIKDVSFKEFWFNGLYKFLKLVPSLHCNHHCMANVSNRNILDYIRSIHNEFI